MKVVIVGAGKLGSRLTKALVGGGNRITVIDVDSSIIARTKDAYDVMTVQEDARNSEVLKDLDISTYDAIITCTDDDEKNIFIASVAKDMGCEYAVARVRDPEHVEQMEKIRKIFNIDYLVNSDYSCAIEIFKYLTDKEGTWGKKVLIGKTEVLELDEKQIPTLRGKTVKEIAPEFEGVLIAAISKAGKIVIPNGNTLIEENDHLFIAGIDSKVDALRKKLRRADKANKLKKVMIGGGGKTSFFLARMLEEAGVSVKVIETNQTRCEYLAERFKSTMVIKGNASDINLLAEEGLDHMDAFVSATGSDEANVLNCLQSSQRGIKTLIAKVSSSYYSTVLDIIDDMMIINPVDMCTTDIVRRISGDASVTFNQMVQGQAEFIEIIAKEGMSLTKDILMNIDIPAGILITSVCRGKEVIIPTGKTQIMPGDKVVILSLLTKVGEREALVSTNPIA